MTPERMFHELLGLGLNWEVKESRFDRDDGLVELELAETAGLWAAVHCPQDGGAVFCYDHTEVLTWRHLNVFEHRCQITCRLPRGSRFAGAGDFASYCRCVKSVRESNRKKKSGNNRKCGNQYLAWAFVEAAHCACRHDGQARRFYDRKKQQTNPAIATKSLACKLAKAAWHVMAEDVPYDAVRVFGPEKKQPLKGDPS